MSTDLRDDLERARQRAPRHDAHAEFGSLLRRHDRRIRVRKVGTLVLALLIGAGVIGGAFILQQSPERLVNAADGGGRDLPTPSGLAMPAGDSLYRRVASYAGSGPPRSTVSTWWASDGSGRVRRGPADDTTFGPGQMITDTGSLDYLSTDAAVLQDQMLQRMAPDGASPEPSQEFTPGPGQPDHVTAGMIRSIGELLDDPNTAPDLRAALFRVATSLDGVQVSEGVLDPVGRSAIELTVTTENMLHRWWFDPQTQQLMARQDDAASGGIEIVEAEGFATSSDSAHTSADLVPAPLHDPQP